MSRSALSVSSDPNVRIMPPERAERVEAAAAKEEPAFPWLTIAICAVLMALYTGSPIDLIPDFIPLAGQLDDLLVDAGLLGLIGRAVFRYYALKHLARGGVRNFLKRAVTGRIFGRFFGRRK
jgi:uncharacterized membrane protein YkvA (DUF1232 family)